MANPILIGYVAACVGAMGNLYVIGCGATDQHLYSWHQDASSGDWSYDGQLCPGQNLRLTSLALAREYVYGGVNMLGIQITSQNLLAPFTMYQTANNGLWSCPGRTLVAQIAPYTPFVVGTGWQKNAQFITIAQDGGFGNLPCLFQSIQGASWEVAGVLCSFNQTFSSAALGVGYNGDLYAILVDYDSSLPCVVWQDSGTGNWTCPAVPLPANIEVSSVAAGVGYNGNLQVLGVGQSDSLVHIWSQDSSTGAWSYTGTPCTLTVNSVAAATDSQGNLQVICLDVTNSYPYVMYQNAGTGQWACPSAKQGTDPLPDPEQLSMVATGVGYGGDLQVIGVGFNNVLYLWSQDASSGEWSSGGALTDLATRSEPTPGQ